MSKERKETDDLRKDIMSRLGRSKRRHVMVPITKEMIRRIEQLQERWNKSDNGLAIAADLNHEYVRSFKRQFDADKQHNLPLESIIAIAGPLRTTARYLIDGEDDDEGTTEASRLDGGDESVTEPPQIDPIIQGLLARLPKAGEVWPESDRKHWLQMLEGAFKLIYKDG